MGTKDWYVNGDEDSVQESDPVINNLKRKAGAAVMQDIGLHTYWANTVGDTILKHPGIHHMYKKELHENLLEAMSSKMTYNQIEEFMCTLGYKEGDVRKCFMEITGVDPVKLEFMRLDDVNSTPANIPWFNLGWGYAKKGDGSLFIMQGGNNLYVVFHQKDDMTREEVAHFLRCDEAHEYLGKHVKNVHRYDMPAKEQVEDSLSKHVKEPNKKEYRVLANYFYDLKQRGELDQEHAKILVRDAVMGGSLTEEEGELMLRVQAADTDLATPGHTEVTPDNVESRDLYKAQNEKNVMDELQKKTPQDFFEDSLPDRIEGAAADHMKGVLSYIANREEEIDSFSVRLFKFEYHRHDDTRKLSEIDPETGRVSGPPLATISALLEVKDESLPEDSSKKYALMVFFVNPDGEVNTSDSIKGEDDIIYGFSEEGLSQYFSREREAK
jgi:hypothetical protein